MKSEPPKQGSQQHTRVLRKANEERLGLISTQVRLLLVDSDHRETCIENIKYEYKSR